MSKKEYLQFSSKIRKHVFAILRIGLLLMKNINNKKIDRKQYKHEALKNIEKQMYPINMIKNLLSY